jgi:membrane associated rhomboid family serine protease
MEGIIIAEPVRPAEKRPYLTHLFLGLMFLVQIVLTILPKNRVLGIYELYSLIPVRLFDGVYLESVVTYIFLHGSWMHLLVNGFALYGTGTIVEKDIGHIKFFGVFIFSGMVAGLFHSFLNSTSGIPLVGASGAIFGVIAVLFLLMPFKMTFALIVPLPSVIVGLMLSLFELSSFWMAPDPGIAHDAHLSGFIFGCVFAFIIDQKRAIRGFLLALIILAFIYFVGIYFGFS